MTFFQIEDVDTAVKALARISMCNPVFAAMVKEAETNSSRNSMANVLDFFTVEKMNARGLKIPENTQIISEGFNIVESEDDPCHQAAKWCWRPCIKTPWGPICREKPICINISIKVES